MAEFDAAVGWNPENIWALSSRARVKIELGDGLGAVSDLAEIVRLDPNSASNHERLGDAYLMIDDFEAAIASYDAAFGLPTEVSPAAEENRGAAKLVLGRLDDAIADFDRLAQSESRIAYALWLDVAQRRAGMERSLPTVHVLLSRTDDLLAPLLPLYLGEATEDEVFAEIALQDPEYPVYRDCIVNFFAAEHSLANGEVEAARRLFDLAAGRCANELAYKHIARAELARNLDTLAAGSTATPAADLTACSTRNGADREAACTVVIDNIAAASSDRAKAYFQRGFAKRSRGDVEGAIADFDSAISIDVMYGAAYANRGVARVARGETGLALSDLGLAIAANNASWDMHRRGAVNMIAGNIDAALDDFDRALAADASSGYAAIFWELALKRGDKGFRTAADFASIDPIVWPGPVLKLIRGEIDLPTLVALATNPDPELQRGQVCEANYYAGELLLGNGDAAGASNLFQKVVNECPLDYDEWAFAKAELARNTTTLAAPESSVGDTTVPTVEPTAGDRCNYDVDPDTAIAECTALLEEQSDDVPYRNDGFVYSVRCRAYLLKLELDAALTDCNAAMEWGNMLAPGAQSLRAAVHAQLGEDAAALADYNAAIAGDPNSADLHLGRGASHRDVADLPAALADFNEAVAIRGSSWDYTNRGIARVLTGDFANAQQDLQLSLQTATGEAHAYTALWLDVAMRRAGVEEYSPSLRDYSHGTDWPGPIIEYFNRGLTKSGLSDVASSESPTTTKEQLCEANLFAAELALIEDRPNEARELFTFAADECPTYYMEGGIARAELVHLNNGAVWISPPRTADQATPSIETSPPLSPSIVEPDSVSAPPALTAPPGEQIELAFWNTIAQSNDPADFQAYLATFPSGAFVALARNRLARLVPETVGLTAPAQP